MNPFDYLRQFFTVRRIVIVSLIFCVAGILPACSKTSTQDKASIETSQAVQSPEKTPLNPVVYELLMTELMRSSQKWPSLDYNLKLRAVEGFINFFKQQEKATIGKPADYYVAKIDEMMQQNPTAPQNIASLLKISAVMDYDYDAGKDKDLLAKEILGPKLYLANKARLAMNNKK